MDKGSKNRKTSHLKIRREMVGLNGKNTERNIKGKNVWKKKKRKGKILINGS